MSRHKSCEAIVLHQAPLAEIHATLTLLCRNEGIIRVIAHGVRGKNSSLRPHCQTFSIIRAYVYEDPQRQSSKLSDAEMLQDFPRIREKLQAIYCAALCSEVLARSPLQPDDSWAFTLFKSYLVAIGPGLSGPLLETATIQFMWRYLDRSGFIPDLYHCAQTGAAFEDNDSIVYSSSLGGFVALAEEAFRNKNEGEIGRRLPIPAGALAYLRFSLPGDFEQSVRVGLASDARRSLLKLSIDLVQDTLGYPLKSIRDPDLIFAAG